MTDRYSPSVWPPFLVASIALAAPASSQAPLDPLGSPPVPAGNPLTPSKVLLGKTLFWEEQLSSTRTVACGTCHLFTGGGADPRSVVGDPRSTYPGADRMFGTDDDVTGSPGISLSRADGTYLDDPSFGLLEQVTRRRARTVVDAAWAPELFWDGRASGTFVDPLSGAVVLASGAALESQVLGPPVAHVEMGHVDREWDEVAARVNASRPLTIAHALPPALDAWIGERGYPQLFAEAFGTPAITPARIAMAIASYERTLVSNQTPLDEALAGGAPLEPIEAEGLDLFRMLRCDQCHVGNRLTDDEYHYIGVRPVLDDLGRFDVTGDPAERGAFRTPTLRNVELRAPYFRNGRFATLEEVIDFYDRGGDFDAPNKDPRIVPLNLTQADKDRLLAFLRRPLTDPRLALELPPFDRPGLYSESARVPVVFGSGVPGSGGFVPEPVALEPPVLGTPSFTIGVRGGRGGSRAVLVIDAREPLVGITLAALPSFARVTRSLEGLGPGNGWSSVSLPIPGDPALVGTELFGRWFVRDAGAAGGLAVSAVVRMKVF